MKPFFSPRARVCALASALAFSMSGAWAAAQPAPTPAPNPNTNPATNPVPGGTPAAPAVAPAAPGTLDLPPPLDAPPAVVDDAPNPVEDAAITAKVKSSLVADQATRSSNIEVDTKGGIVILNGTVTSSAEAERAVRIAGAIEGVRTVTNNLRFQ